MDDLLGLLLVFLLELIARIFIQLLINGMFWMAAAYFDRTRAYSLLYIPLAVIVGLLTQVGLIPLMFDLHAVSGLTAVGAAAIALLASYLLHERLFLADELTDR